VFDTMATTLPDLGRGEHLLLLPRHHDEQKQPILIRPSKAKAIAELLG